MIYRVTTRRTGSVQPGEDRTLWDGECRYCGEDQTAARVAFHKNTSADFGGSPGSQCRETIMEGSDDDDMVTVIDM